MALRIPAARGEGPFPVRARRLAGETTVVAVAAWAWAVILYRLWDASLRVPIYQDRSDVRFLADLVQTIETRGWFQSNPRLGAPFGQTLYDFPHGGETWQLLMVKALSLVSRDYGLTMNLYYIGGFGLTAAVTYLVLRHLRFSAVPAGIAAFLYTFLPFHFYHEQSHLFRSSYWYAPLAGLLLLWSWSWRERFLVDPDPPAKPTRRAALAWTLRSNLRRGRVAAALALAVLLGGTETMTTSFTLVLLALTAVIGAIHHREPVRLLVNGALMAVLGATFVVMIYPTLNYARVYGTNKEAGRRVVTEQEIFGLKIDAMVLPSVDHRSRLLNRIGNEAQTTSLVRSEGGQALTTLGALGFLAAIAVVLTRGLGRGGRDTRPVHDRAAVLHHASVLAVVATLVATIAGFAMVLSVFGFAQVRVWNRMVILIAFWSMLVTLLGIEWLTGWVRRRLPRPGLVLAAAAVVLGAFGTWDGGKPAARDYDAMAADFRRDRDFVRRIEASVPDGTMVFELPVIKFPEQPPVGNMKDYDLLRPFLQSDGSTSWSYGAVKGRPAANWQVRVRDLGITASLPGLLGMGFDAVWVDTYGFADGGAAVRAEIEAATAARPMVASDGRYLFFDLRAYRARLGRPPADLRSEARRVFGVEPPAG